MKIKILYESEAVLVVDKPAGMVVNRAESVRGETVQDFAEKRLNFPTGNESEVDNLFRKRSGIAHRLDKETSGCLLLAKKPEALKELLAQFKERKIKKEYLALVHGKLEPKEGEIFLPLRRGRKDRKKFVVSAEGKSARTGWRVEERLEYDGEKFSLVRLMPLTGRTHQIRVHMAHLNHPLFADEKYLNHKKVVKDRIVLKRHFLHAARLIFMDPGKGRVEVESPLPEELGRVLELMQKE